MKVRRGRAHSFVNFNGTGDEGWLAKLSNLATFRIAQARDQEPEHLVGKERSRGLVRDFYRMNRRYWQ